jgi:hypothetical protein
LVRLIKYLNTREIPFPSHKQSFLVVEACQLVLNSLLINEIAKKNLFNGL